MRPIFKYLLKKIGKDSTHIYQSFLSSTLAAKSGIILIIGVATYEYAEYSIRKKKDELSEKFTKIKNFERELKEKRININ